LTIPDMIPTSIRFTIVIVACLLSPAMGFGQYASQRGVEVASVDANTRWGFRSLSPVTLASPIVRLGDVAVPLNPNMAGWQRLRRFPIGLVPLDGHPMTIDRNRLTELILAAEATPQTIDWVGPDKIVVLHDPHAEARSDVATTAFSSPVPMATNSFDGNSVAANPLATVAPSTLSPSDAKRITQWIDRAISSFLPETLDQYAIDIDVGQPELARLDSLVTVTSVQWLETPREGEVLCRVSARGVSGPIEAKIAVKLTAHPMAVVARKSLQRGERIQAADVELQTIKRDQWKPDYFTEASEVIGMEVRSSLSANRPISRDRVGSPILVQRGELIDVQVVGGGITVSTKAKALDAGSASDLIEIETLDPRKRLVGRVVQAGLVEIVTRAPSVRR
jgi:flagella basal body P-ring formation protein FlgA